MARAADALLRAKARRLAEQRITQLWLLVSPREATALVNGIVPPSVQQQARLSLLTMA